MRGLAVLTVVSGVLTPVTPTPAAAAVDAWSPSGLHGGTVLSLAASPSSPSLVLAGTAGGGVFRSTDSGSTWTRSSTGLPVDATIGDLVLVPSSPQVVYAGTTERGLFRSTDAGATWSPASTGISSAGVGGVAVHPTNPSVLLGAAGADAWRSTDGAETWQAVRGPDGTSLFSNAMAFASADPRVAYSFGASSWRSTDSGATWRQLLAAPPHVAVASVDPRTPDVVLVGSGDGVQRSTDGGASWTPLVDLPPGDDVVSLHRDPARPDTVFAGTYYGRLLRTDDGGATWRDDVSGLPAGERLTDVALTASGPLVSTSHRGVFRRPATGTTWTATNAGLRASHVGALAVPPGGGPRVYAGTEREGVFRSADSGRTFTPAGLAGRVVTGLAVSPSSDTTLWAAAEDGLHRSTDAGTTWVRQLSVPYESITDVAVSPSRPTTLYATSFEGGTFRSDDSGTTWRRLALPGEVVAWSVAVHPTDPDTAWVGTRFDGVARTTDGGATWTDTFDAVFYDVLDVSVDPRAPSRVYAALSDSGVYRSSDGGSTWSRATGGDPPQAAATVVADPTTPGRVWAAGYGYRRPGAFVSQDHGATWTPLDTGLTTRWSMAMAVQTSGTAHLGTTAYGRASGGGAFQYTPSHVAPPALPVLTLGDVTVPEGDAGAASAVVPVRLSSPSTATVSASWTTTTGTAGTTDFRSASGTVSFPPGTTSRTVPVSVLGDPVDEPTESFTVTLSAPQGATAGDGTAVVTVRDDDAAPQVRVSDVRVWEGDAGAASAVFTVRLSAPAPRDVTVDYATAGGTARSGTDFSARTGSLVLAAGQVSRSVAVPVRVDTADEPHETFSLDLTGLTGPAVLADARGTATVLDDDPRAAGSMPDLRIGDLVLTEGHSGTTAGTLTVRLSTPRSSPVTAAYGLTAGTAGATDFTVRRGTVTVPAGATSASVPVAVRGDATDEPTERFTATLSSPSGATLADASGTVTIVDDDARARLTVSDVAVAEGDGGPGSAAFTVRLTAPSTTEVTVDHATVAGTAAPGSDYTARTGTLTFAPGEVSRVVTVTTSGDTAAEGDEVFTLDLSGPVGADLADPSGRAVLRDDDG